MKRIPKTPIEFDYDLWISEDGKCMVRDLELHFIHPLLGNCYIKYCLFRITMIKQKAFTILFG